MKKLIIRNIGPIKNIEIELNKVNVFMGPQSSGKSTITKIACYCAWVEKNIMATKKTDFSVKGEFAKELVRFHKLEEYLNDDSFISYETEILSFTYCHKNMIFELTEKDGSLYTYKKSKIGFIPSERNIVAAIPNWVSIDLYDNNIRSFMVDFDNARSTHKQERPFNIMNLAKYYYDSKTEKDYVVINDGKKLELTYTSSGFQSLIPLYIMMDYYYDRIFNIKLPQSVRNLRYEPDLNDKILSYIEKKFSNESDDFRLQKLSEIKRNYIDIHNSNIFLEEPEQNLFPTAQRDLVYDLLKMVQNINENMLTITTHSPYILYALNNCMMGYKIKSKMPQDEQNDLLSKSSWLNPESVSIWQTNEDGELEPINKGKTGTVSEHYFNSVLNEVVDEYYAMLNYIEL